jgi:response regulator RpfG family c-di-GMP phosphodiesterase
MSNQSSGGASGYRPQRPKNVILASRTEEENHLLYKKLLNLNDAVKGGTKITTSRPQLAKLELSGEPDLVIFNVNDWNRDELKYVQDLRAEGYKELIMILAKADVPTAVQNLQLLDRVVYLEKPYEVRDLIGITSKALMTGTVEQQFHKRFITEQEATVEFKYGKGVVSSRVFNMSKTGAYLELNALQDVSVGETVRVRLELENVSRTYLMPARVVWTQVMGRTGGTGIGIHFTGRGDVKRHMFQV